MIINLLSKEIKNAEHITGTQRLRIPISNEKTKMQNIYLKLNFKQNAEHMVDLSDINLILIINP